MDGIQTHPSNAAQAKAFTAPGSLSFPNAGQDYHNGRSQSNGQQPQINGASYPNGSSAVPTNGVAPATPAATPGAQQGGSGLTPTLQ